MTTSPARRGYSATAKVAVQAGAARAQAMHGAIAAQTFDIIEAFPSLRPGAAAARRLHDAISSTVYAAIHHGGGLLLDAADAIERRRAATTADPDPPGRIVSNVRSAINGAFGDELAGMDSVLAIPMALYRQGHALELTPEALRASWPHSGPDRRLVLFLHGLCCNERCWESPDGIDMPRQFASDSGSATLTLRYNTGLAVAENGRLLAALLERLCAAWPHPLDDLVIVGHSMGGLLARSAVEVAAADHLTWPTRLRMVICLGTPHLGSPLERAGRIATTALGLSRMTEPLARIAARRSQGIRDLHDGMGAVEGNAARHIAWRFIGGSLAGDPQGPLGRLFGDGLVTPVSATAHSAGHAGDVRSVRLGGVGHMGLLNDSRVYAQVRDWVTRNGSR